MTAPDLRTIALVLGGEVAGDEVLAPGPGHGPRDRSLSVKLSSAAPDGFIVCSFASDDWRECLDHVRGRLGLPHDGWKRERPRLETPPTKKPPDPNEREKARWFWRQGRPVADTIADIYLRQPRGYGGIVPPTLRFLPARDDYAPALMAAFGMPTEPEPGVLAIADDAVMAAQLIKLKPDGSGKADVEPNKIIIGKGALGSPIALAPPNDLLGLAITEGLENGLTIHEATGLGAWASGGATRLPALAVAVPSYIDCVTVVADDDAAGRRYAPELVARLRQRGIEAIAKVWPS